MDNNFTHPVGMSLSDTKLVAAGIENDFSLLETAH
jgi:hypothetical protein